MITYKMILFLSGQIYFILISSFISYTADNTVTVTDTQMIFIV